MPALGLLMTWAVLGETLHPTDLLGTVPVAPGIWLATRPDPGAPAPAAIASANSPR